MLDANSAGAGYLNKRQDTYMRLNISLAPNFRSQKKLQIEKRGKFHNEIILSDIDGLF